MNMERNSVFKMIHIPLIVTIVLSAVCAVGSSDSPLPRKQSHTYSDFLQDVSIAVQQSGKPEQASLMKSLNDQIYDLYLPTLSYIISSSKSKNSASKNDNDKLRDANTNTVSSISSESKSSYLKWEPMQNHGTAATTTTTTTTITEPALLRKILNSIQKVGVNRNTNNYPINSNSNPKSNTTSTCIDDVGRLITELLSGKSWAVQFIDATGKPGPSLTRYHLNFIGNYDQCLDASAPPPPAADRAQKRQLGFTGSYFRINFLTGIPLLVPRLGACLPDTCSALEISHLVQDMVNGSKFMGMTIYPYAEKLPQPTEMTTATISAICILSVIGIFMVIGTIIDVVVVQSWRNKEDLAAVNSGQDNAGYRPYENTPRAYQGIGDSGVSGDSILRSGDINTRNQQHPINDENAPLIYSPHHPTNTNNSYPNGVRAKFNLSGLMVKVFLAFSVYTNGQKLLNTTQNPGSLGAIHGIRFLSMSWVVLCHWYAFSLSFIVNASDGFPDMIKRWSFLPILNGFSSVDSFFTLSGLLTAYLTIKEMNRKEKANINWFMFYFHRFWRLTPPYMLSMLTVLGFSQYLGEGPMWATTQPGDKIACEKNWWTNLLYVNNLVNTDEACFGHSWYLANDMQFFVLSPLMLVPFFFNKFYGLLSCLVVLVTSWITTGVLSTIHKWPTSTISLHPVPGMAKQPEWFAHYYLVPWCRIGPFVVGIMAGYLLAMTKGRPFKMPGWVVVLGWVTAVASGLAVVYGLRGDIMGDNPSSVGVAALYNAVSRSVWGACVCWVVVACSAGYGGPVNALLSWSPFVFLGRLTYMVYLIHLCIGGTFYQSLGALLYFNDKIMVTTFLGVFTFVNMAAFVAVLALESPMLGLEKIFLKRDRGNNGK